MDIEDFEETLDKISELAQKGCAVNAEQMLELELEIVATTDKLAGIITRAAVSRSLIHEEVMSKERETAIAALGQETRIRDKGLKPINIQPLRGDAFRVESRRFHGKKKGGSPQH